MPTLHLLGTGGAATDPHRTTTMLAFQDDDATLVVDCGGDVVQRLLSAGIALDTITGLVVTHEHPDHVSGFPLFMEKIWLAGRRAPLPLYGIRPALDQARRCFETFDTSGWDGLPEIQEHEIAQEEGATVLDDAHWHVKASPGQHATPVVGLRVESKRTGRVVAYSCDTEPAPAIERLAHQAYLLVHEANGEGPGHTSMRQAAEVARRSEAERLLLVHLPAGNKMDPLQEARGIFPATELGEELGAYAF